jgi:hypothetical protein
MRWIAIDDQDGPRRDDFWGALKPAADARAQIYDGGHRRHARYDTA